MTLPLRVLTLSTLVLASCSEPTDPGSLRLAPRLSETGSQQVAVTFFGPEKYVRTTGASNVFTRQIVTDHYKAPFTLHVRNGDADGSHRVSSAIVKLDGAALLSQKDFSQNAVDFTLGVSAAASATLEVTLNSAPGGYLEIWLEGVRRGTRFDGVYTNSWMIGQFLHTDRAVVTGSSVTDTHSFSDGSTSGGWSWTGTITVSATDPNSGTITGSGTRWDSCCGTISFVLDEASIQVNSDGTASLFYGATDPRFGAFGSAVFRQ